MQVEEWIAGTDPAGQMEFRKGCIEGRQRAIWKQTREIDTLFSSYGGDRGGELRWQCPVLIYRKVFDQLCNAGHGLGVNAYCDDTGRRVRVAHIRKEKPCK